MSRLTCKYDGINTLREMCTFDRESDIEADDCLNCEEYCDTMDALGGDCDNCAIQRAFNKLAEYEDLEEQGLLLKLTPIKDFEEYYAVDMFGCIYGISKEVGNGRRILKRKTTPSKNGYEYVNLKANGIVKNKRVHRIVAEAFIPNPNNYPDVNHIDGNKLNNCVWNLEWCSKKWNSQHAFNNNLSKQLTNYKDGVWKNGKNKYALITNTVTNESKMFNSFKLATQYLGRGKDYIWQHISKGNYTFNSREYKIQVFLTKEEAEQELERMESAE